MNNNFRKMEADLIVLENVNNKPVEHTDKVERQCWPNAHYSGRESLKVVGISASTWNENLERKKISNICLIRCQYWKHLWKAASALSCLAYYLQHFRWQRYQQVQYREQTFLSFASLRKIAAWIHHVLLSSPTWWWV